MKVSSYARPPVGAPVGAGYVPGAARRTEMDITGEELRGQVEDLLANHPATSTVSWDSSRGRLRAGEEGGRLLPLRLGALDRALGRIARGDGWLMDRQPVVIYTGQDRHVHIDFINLAGFAVDPAGGILWRSVNPW
jgi:hypothetical protein